MKLYIKDRIVLFQILPETNSFKDYSIKQSIIKTITFTEAEIAEYKIENNQAEHRVSWDKQLDAEKPLVVDFTDEQKQYIKAACESLSETPRPDDFWSTLTGIYEAL
jgi:hypothetical protein